MSQAVKRKKGILDYLFCLVVGGVYLYAIMRAVIGATFIQVEQRSLVFIGIVGITFFMLVLYNMFTRLLVAGIVLFVLGYVALTFEYFIERYPQVLETFLMVTGQIAYQRDLGVIVVWAMGLVLGFAIVVFMLHFFNFYLLLMGGAAAFIFTWIPDFNRDETAFLIFLVAFSLILVRKTTRSVAAGFTAAPICIAVIFLANSGMPVEHSAFTRRYINPARVDAFSDFVYELFNPAHFRFQTTGFSGAGGRLGGPVTPNNRSVMSVIASGRMYLAGATSNVYTGDRWIQTLREGDIYTHGLPPAEFEMLETAAALIRGATHVDFRADLPLADIWVDNGLPVEDLRRLHSRMFSTLGMVGDRSLGDIMGQRRWYWHTYLPIDTMTIVQGQNRTGTVFLPPRATDIWFAEDSYDYAPYLEILPTGNMQTPSFMSRGAGYHIRFLNVDTQLSFIEDILRTTNPGVHERPQVWLLESPRVPLLDGNDLFVSNIIIRTDDRTDEITETDFDELNDFIVTGVTEARGMATLGRMYAVREDFHSSALVLQALPQTLDVQGFAEILGMYFDGRQRLGAGMSYLPDETVFMNLLDRFSAEILAEYSRQVRQHFMQIPDITPRRVFDITEEIIAGLDNDFDRVMAIRDYLLQFPYTLDPVPVPRGVCFVDFFLFEGREGYCTYFASAMALMARIAGVPSRYVEGFVIPPSGVAGEPVTVTNRMAHAWAEVYLEGFGWKTIEATPTYAFLMDPYVPLPAQGAISPTWTDTSFMDRMSDMMSDWEIEQDLMQGFFGERPYTPAAEYVYEYEETPPHITMLILLSIAIAISMIVILTLCWRIKYNQWRVNSSSPNEQVKTYFHALMAVVTYHTMPLLPEETEKAYATHMGRRFAFRSDTIFLRDLINLYYKAKYSPTEITKEEAGLMKEAHGDMLRLLRSLRNKYVFLYLRYVRGLGSV